MGAPIGNKFWLLRSKHGRDKLFATPNLMWDAACEYFQWCIDNPLISVEYYGKDAEMREVPKMRPFTKEGLCRYLCCDTAYFRDFRADIKAKGDSKTQLDKDFSAVTTRIDETIYDQKFAGAAAGFLNANIIIRDLQLRDTNNVNVGGQPDNPVITGITFTK